MCWAVVLQVGGPACSASPPTCEGHVNLARRLIRLLANGATNERVEESCYSVLVELGPSVDAAFKAELSEEKQAGGRFLLLQQGETLIWRGIRLDSALQQCLAIAVEHARAIVVEHATEAQWLDNEVLTFACHLSAEILAERREPITETSLALELAQPEDSVTEYIIRRVIRIVHSRLRRKKELDKKKPRGLSNAVDENRGFTRR